MSSSVHSCRFKIFWITLQMILALIGPYPESTAHFHPYVSEFRYIPQYHPSRNPDCRSRQQWFRRDFHQERSPTLEDTFVDEQTRPWIEIRAILARGCAKTRRKEIVAEASHHRQSIRKCRRRVIISMKINNVGKTNTREEFVLVDHVLDPIKMRKIRLRNPYVVKVRQEPLLHLYGLRFQGVVNAEAKEEVINNRRTNFTGCNDGVHKPTCGQMLIDGQPIPFSQGFCCSCESSKVDAGSFHSVAKSNYRRDRANSSRNRSAESTADLFDNPKAQRQVEGRGKGEEEEEKEERANGNAPRRVTSHDISAVNGPLGEQASSSSSSSSSSSRKHQEEEPHGNNSAQSSEGFPRELENAKTLSPVPKSEPMQTRSKIEAYIESVYERAMRERIATKQEGYERNSTDECDRAGNINVSRNESRGSRIHGNCGINDGRTAAVDESIAGATRPNDEHIHGETGDNDGNKWYLDPEKRLDDGSTNFSEKSARNRSYGATRLENTLDYAATSPAIHSSRGTSRIPEKESQFSGRAEEKNARFIAPPDNASFATTLEFVGTFRTPFSRACSDRSVNYDVAPMSTVRSDDFAVNVHALLSKLVISEARTSMENEEGRRYGFRTSESNASRDASKENVGEAESEGQGNANVSTRIPAAPAFTGLRNLSSTVGGISKPAESPAAARPGNKSSTRILESGTRGSLPTTAATATAAAHEKIQERKRAGNPANLYGSGDSRGIYNPSKQAPKNANSKNSYKFGKPRRKSRKGVSARKFPGYGDTDGHARNFERSNRESRRKRASSDFKHSRKRPRRNHPPKGGKDSNSAIAASEKLNSKNQDSRRKTQVFLLDHALPKVSYSKIETSKNTGNGSPKKRAILETGHPNGKVQSERDDNAFLGGNDRDKESNVDKRIGDKFVRISNVSREDSIGASIQETPRDFAAAVTKSEVAKAGIPETRDEPTSHSFSIRETTHEYLLADSDRIARQYAGYTPIAPGVPTTLAEITEAKTLPFRETTSTTTQLTATSAGIPTIITDVAFRPPIRPLGHPTTPSSREMLDEISLDEITFVDETEATIKRDATAPKLRTFQTGRLDATSASSEEKARGRKHRRDVTTRHVTASNTTKMTDAEEKDDDHPWYRATEKQQIIAADRSEKIQKAEAGKEKKRRYNKVESFRGPRWSTSTTAVAASRVADGIVPARTRSKRSGFIRESSGDRDSSIFCDHDGAEEEEEEEEGEDEENRQNGRTALNRNVESPDATGLPELRSEIEERLADGSDYPVNRGSLRHTYESQKRTARKRNVDGLGSIHDTDSPNKKNLPSFQPRRMNDDAFNNNFDEEISWRNREVTSTSIATSSSATEVLDSPRDPYGSMRQTNRRTDDTKKRVFGECSSEIDKLVVLLRQTGVNSSSSGSGRIANAEDDLSIVAVSRQPKGRISPSRARSISVDQDKSREADTVIRGDARLMTGRDKGEMGDRGDLDVAARRSDKNVVPSSSSSSLSSTVAKRRREDASKINEDPVDVRRAQGVSAAEKYLRRPLGKVYDTVREIIGKLKKGESSSNAEDIERSVGRSEERANSNRRRSGRRLLSSGKSSYIENVEDDEHYYEDDDESETGERNDSTGDNIAIAGSDDSSDLEDRRRKLVAVTNRLVDENIDDDGSRLSKAETVAAMISDNAQAISEEEISRKNEEEANDKKINSEEESPDIDSIYESIDHASDNKVRQDLFAKGKDSIVKNAANNDSSLQKQSFYDSEEALRNPGIYDEQPLSLGDEINNGDFIRDELLYSVRSTPTVINAEEIVLSSRPIEGETLGNVDLSRDLAKPRNDGNVKISLSGRIRVNGGFNRTSVLVSFDAVPEEQSTTATTTILVEDSSVSAGSPCVIAAAESTAINLPLDGPNNDKSAFHLPSAVVERANDEAYDSLNTSSDGGRELGKTNASEDAIKSRARKKKNKKKKFFDFARGSERRKEQRKLPGGSTRIERRLDKDNANSRTAKQVFLTDYSRSDGGTSAEGKTISRRIDEAIDKLDPSSSPSSSVYFPDILGCVLVDNGSLENRDAIATSAIEKPRVTSGGCYKPTAIARKLDPPEATEPASRNLRTSSDYPDSDHATSRSGLYYEATTKDRCVDAAAVSSSSSAEPRSDVTETANGYSGNGKPCSSYSDKSVDAIRTRNMMAVARFMMKLLRIVTEENEEPSCPTARVEKNLVVDGASRGNTTDFGEKSAADKTIITPERNFTNTGGNRAECSSLENSTFESFTSVATSRCSTTSITSPGEALKDDGLYTLFETSTTTEVYGPALTTARSLFPESFLFYEHGPESLREEIAFPRRNTSVVSTGKNCGVSFNDTKVDTGRERSRLNDSRDQSFVERLGKQETASTNFERDNGSVEPRSIEGEYSAAKSTAFRNDIGPMLSRDSLLGRIERKAAREKHLERAKKKKKKKPKKTVSDRRATRTKLLDSSTRGGDWPPVDTKLEEETPEKVVFRRARGKINRLRDPNIVGDGGNDSIRIEGRAVDGDRRILTVDDDLDLSAAADSTASPRGSSSRLDEETANEYKRSCDLTVSRNARNKKRDVGERRDFRTDKRVSGERQKNKKKKKKKKKKKGYQRETRDTSEIRNRRFKRHLLMASLAAEPTYDADDATARRRPGRYIPVGGQNAEDFPQPAEGNDGTRTTTVDGSEADPAGRAQIRGGQDCTDRRHPANIDAAKYLESAHCLRFSDLWYSVYQLEYPVVEHTVYLSVYEKRVLPNGSAYWEDLTGDSTIRLGTFNRHHRRGEDTIAFAYKEVKMSGRERVPNLDVAHDRLLVPSSVTSKGSEYPVEGESDEYLVVPADSINVNGNECDKAGVGFAAFVGQPNRCERVSETCLKNQPLAYRRHDTEAREAGRPGCYFLSNFATVPGEAIKYSANGSGSREFLALEYHSPHVSAIDIEIRTGYNAALAGGPLGCISEVHVDSMTLDRTVVTVVITNRGSNAATYRSRIVDCPAGLPQTWLNATFPKKIVEARRDQTVSLNLYGELRINEFYCSVQLLNRLGEPVATRRIKIRKKDRCSCVLHCVCVCVGDAGCRPLSPELYHAAGFRGPVPTVPPERGIFADATVDVLLFSVSLILLLLFVGLLKWLIGLYIPAVGRWGLDYLLETGGMSEYLERELKHKYVVTDERGAPVHPDTRRRTVRICSRKAECLLNVMFFPIFPFAVCLRRLKNKSFLSVRKTRRNANASKISLTSDKNERPRMICVSIYGDSRDSKMETEDTKYVMDELNKSEESLRGRDRSKVSVKRSRCTKGYCSRH